jgi:hypothetical protein
VFFEPRAIRLEYAESEVARSWNMALLFHEALHGFTKMSDADLQRFLGCTVRDDTSNITAYLQQFVGYLYPLAGYPRSCQNTAFPGNVCRR